jgi:REP element-mobilizing transposase RayT
MSAGPRKPTDQESPPRGWHYRGYLPHYDATRTFQSITYRLADSLPRAVVKRFAEEAAHLPYSQGELRKRIDQFLDAGHGGCVLRQPAVAAQMIEAWRHFDGSQYHLHAWVVMPNHGHVLCEPLAGHTVAELVRSWKSFTARRINRLLGRSGALWMEDYWDRYMRDEAHYHRVVEYIHDNPVKAGLVKEARDWPWSSVGR